MIITDELFQKTWQDAQEEHSRYDSPSDPAVLAKITGTRWNIFRFPYLNYFVSPSDKKEYKEWVEKNIIDHFGLVPGSYEAVMLTGQRGKVAKKPTMYFGDGIVLLTGGIDGSEYNGFWYDLATRLDDAVEIINSWIDFASPREESKKEIIRYVDIMVRNKNGFFTSSIPLGKRLNIDLTKNYMPDLPDEAIREKLVSDKGGFFIFNGDPGTGKSTYIKHLIEDIKGVDFVLLDANSLQDGAEDFKNYMISNVLNDQSLPKIADDGYEDYNNTSPSTSSIKPKVFILEDAEKLLLKRSELTNPVNLSNILNITDGILGDMVKVKFICTFNCSLSDVDPALLRKGRLLQKYEFPKLSGETLGKLADELGIPGERRKARMSLAEIYGWDIDTGLSDSDKNKIGF